MNGRWWLLWYVRCWDGWGPTFQVGTLSEMRTLFRVKFAKMYHFCASANRNLRFQESLDSFAHMIENSPILRGDLNLTWGPGRVLKRCRDLWFLVSGSLLLMFVRVHATTGHSFWMYGHTQYKGMKQVLFEAVCFANMFAVSAIQVSSGLLGMMCSLRQKFVEYCRVISLLQSLFPNHMPPFFSRVLNSRHLANSHVTTKSVEELSYIPPVACCPESVS